jgi:hypothetical protein
MYVPLDTEFRLEGGSELEYGGYCVGFDIGAEAVGRW